MKLRKKEKSLRKNFSFPPWIIKDFHGGIVQHPENSIFLIEMWMNSSCINNASAPIQH